MTRGAAFVAIAIAGGFLVGFLWGRGTRDAMSSATQTSYADGVLTVKLDTRQALTQGLAGLWR